ncbi:iron complex transport system substrate-binding protein [Mycolicibacterium sp. BK556]|uniref:ABC transporter substrate-binding protein n=1 Tax=Mycobacteriaceae TaxID=1762 RepID=UPI00105EE85F|nr:ABC transporter substrate-binding protein [Mycobacterium sp. BK086]MBB3600677.1 iron complex transport system substrate-binding protein [Mycolicibacterium sp. BK556]MBB3630430.1 iron complex transport system substrate-binding protein [Mycolicibacterium sp. BK607]MBB3748421.1 iron complex transport system substrate-binding protein [Mycolicibacterium sp. BK634]TDO10217.1 iron complex transport system substrate-binding protein [Mycobacterium sp. BK086]
MRAQWSRRGFLGAAGAAGALLVAACSSDGSSDDAAPKSVTIKHLFGETTISAPPKRVVSAGFTEQDDLLAVGVVPIAVTNWFGDQPFGVWPWAQPKLGAAQPVVLNLDNGIQVDQIAALKPDLIVAVNAGLDEDTYKKLTAIAPTIAQSDNAFFEPWKDQATAVGTAVFQGRQMKQLIAGVDSKFADVAKNNTAFKDKKVALLAGNFFGGTLTATLPGWRTDFLTTMGFQVIDSIQAYAADDHRAAIPHDKLADALDAADVLIWSTESDAEQAALLADPAVAALAATKQNRNVFTGKDLAGAIAFASPLSYPVVADQLPPLLSRALG